MFERVLRNTLLCLCTLVAPAAAADLDDVMSALASTPHGRVGFVERQHLALLDRPVESSGELLYTPPDHLEKRTLKPKPSSLIVAGDVLTVQRGARKHVMQLRDYPQAAPFINSIRATLAGDRATLERHFKVQMQGSREQWLLELTPLAAQGKGGVAQISMRGAGGDLKAIDILQTDQDRSELLITAPPPP